MGYNGLVWGLGKLAAKAINLSQIQEYKGTKVHKFKNTRVQKYKRYTYITSSI